MKRILFALILFVSMAAAAEPDSAYESLYDLLSRKYPSYKPYPMVLFPAFMVPDSTLNGLPKCVERVYLNVFSYDIRVCRDRAHGKHVLLAMVYSRQNTYRLLYYYYHPVSKSWEEKHPPIVVKVPVW